MEAITMPDAAARLAEPVDRAARAEAFEITQNGHAAVLLSVADSDGPANETHAGSMRRAIEQLDAGQGRDLHVVMDEVRAKLTAMQAVQEGGSAE